MKDFIKQILRGLLPVTSEPQNPKGGWPAQKSLPSVDVLIDVGIGQQGTPGLYENINASSFIFIDPVQECEQAVQTLLADNKNNMFICCALGEKIQLMY